MVNNENMDNVRLNLTENEKVAQVALGLGDHMKFNMQENNLNTLINREKANKFNDQVDAYNEALNENNKKTEQAQSELPYDIEKAELNPVSGKYEEQKEFIVTGCVVEVGPDVKYLQEGDVIYYRRDTVVPVPFFKQGLVSLAENQVIAAVNEGLTERFKRV